MVKLDIILDFDPTYVYAKVELSGAANRNGRYLGIYNKDLDHASMESSSKQKFPLAMSWDCNSVADFVRDVTDYFERHGAFI